MKHDQNNPEELRQEILYRVERGEMPAWARRAANVVMRAAGRILLMLLAPRKVQVT